MTIAHVPTALTLQGDTLMTVAAQLSRAERNAGEIPLVILAEGRSLRVDHAENLFVDYTRYCPRTYFTRREVAIDVVAGTGGARRPYHGRMFLPAVEAVRDRGGVDVVLLYEGHYAAPSLPWWNELRPKTKVLLYVHNPLSRTYRARELQRLLGHCDGLIFCADHLRADAARRLGDRTTVPLHVVHNGVDPLFSALEPRIGPRPADAPFEVVFAGRVVPVKGPHILLEAITRARQRTTRPLRCHIVGSSSYRPSELSTYELRLRTQAEKEGIDVEFTPFVNKARVKEIYQSASAVCLPSAWAEGLPLTALEAMATGAPIIASRSPGLVEACGDAAIYAPMGESGGLADAIVQLAEDPAELARLSDASRTRAREFTWEAAAQDIGGLTATL